MKTETASKEMESITRGSLCAVLRRLYGESAWVDDYDPVQGIVIFSDDKGRYWKSTYTVQDGVITIDPTRRQVTRRDTWIEAPPVQGPVQGLPVLAAAQKGDLGGPIVMKNPRKQIAYGAVLVPGEPDRDGEAVTKERIEDFAHGFMEHFQKIDRQHDLTVLDAVPVESYLTPVELDVTVKGKTIKLPVGTWILGTKIRDKVAWKAVESGELEGYSIMGVRRQDLATALKEWPGTAAKGLPPYFRRVTLEDLGVEDVVVPFVSLCKEPTVPKAMFFALKSEEPSSWFDRLRGWVGKEGRAISDANYQRLRRVKQEIDEMLRVAESERGEGGHMEEAKVVEIVGKALQPLAEKLTAIERAMATLKAEPTPKPESPEVKEIGALKARVTELEAAVKARTDELAALKAALETKVTALTTKMKAQPRGVGGQDGEPAPAARNIGRDALGRSRKEV